MKFTNIICATLLLCGCTQRNYIDNQNEQNFYSCDDRRIVYMGRVSHLIKDTVRFTYPGVSIKAQFSGTSIKMHAKAGSGFFMVEIDDKEPFKIDFSENESSIILASSLQDTLHNVSVMYAIEGYEKRPEFYGFTINGILKDAPKLPLRKIEFIGNSITCGYGIEGNVKEHFSYDTENHYYTYAARTARALNAQHLVVARSGIGIYRNYGAPIEGSYDDMPYRYEETLFLDTTEMWNHNLFVPDIVCVNLGTNDTSLNTYDVKKIEEGYSMFIDTLRCHYPDAQIVMLTGTMMSGKALSDIKMILDKVVISKNDAKLHRFDMTPLDCEGSDYHPSKIQHEQMAKELIDYLGQFYK